MQQNKTTILTLFFFWHTDYRTTVWLGIRLHVEGGLSPVLEQEPSIAAHAWVTA